MLKKIYFFLSLLNHNQKKGFYLFQFLVIIMTLFEILTIFLIGPYLASLMNLETSSNEIWENFFSIIFNLKDSNDLIIYLSIFVLFFILTSAIISIFIQRYISVFAAKLGSELSTKLFSYYISQNLAFHTSKNSSKLTNNIIQELQRIIDCVLIPFLNLNAKIILTAVILMFLFIFNPKATFF